MPNRHGGYRGHDNGDHNGHRRHGGWGGWGRWNDFGIFGLPYPYAAYPYAANSLLLGAPAVSPLTPYYRQGLPLVPQYGGIYVGQEAAVVPAPVAPVGVVGPLGFKSRRIREGKTRTVYARTETAAFQPQSLFIPRRVARHFEIREISVGGICLLGGSSCAGIPAELYSNEGCAGPAFLQLPPIIPGMAVRLRVKNISDDSHRFRAALNGLFFY